MSRMYDHNSPGCCRHHVRSRCAWLRGGQIPVVAAPSPSHRTQMDQEETMNASGSVSPHTFVSQDAWLAARRDLLNEEKQLTKQQQRVAAARRRYCRRDLNRRPYRITRAPSLRQPATRHETNPRAIDRSCSKAGASADRDNSGDVHSRPRPLTCPTPARAAPPSPHPRNSAAR